MLISFFVFEEAKVVIRHFRQLVASESCEKDGHWFIYIVLGAVLLLLYDGAFFLKELFRGSPDTAQESQSRNNQATIACLTNLAAIRETFKDVVGEMIVTAVQATWFFPPALHFGQRADKAEGEIPSGMVAEDTDGDGKFDIYVGNVNISEAVPLTVVLFLAGAFFSKHICFKGAKRNSHCWGLRKVMSFLSVLVGTFLGLFISVTLILIKDQSIAAQTFFGLPGYYKEGLTDDWKQKKICLIYAVMWVNQGNLILISLTVNRPLHTWIKSKKPHWVRVLKLNDV